jgi:hypothetical protein
MRLLELVGIIDLWEGDVGDMELDQRLSICNKNKNFKMMVRMRMSIRGRGRGEVMKERERIIFPQQLLFLLHHHIHHFNIHLPLYKKTSPPPPHPPSPLSVTLSPPSVPTTVSLSAVIIHPPPLLHPHLHLSPLSSLSSPHHVFILLISNINLWQ